MAKKLTLTDLIKEKEKYQVKSNITKDLFIKRIGASITIKKAERALCLECIEMANDPEREDMADIHMLYNTVTEPNLKDTELHEAYDCKEPYDIVEKIFEPGEIASIAGEGMELSGYGSGVKAVEDLKN
ncbi:phage tail assembly chaperone [Lysinibacillus sp. JNUCC 51]|uniref:phage tail assembly chaperone n=1 Tax=Lysinibacillus sp. JNUCC-51 TaxID=2792479 RepID=UPI001936DAC7|nr:hypothetical protein JNUCC51_00365 [Lysinibacillus sp. JNUCC-51]